MPASGRDLQIRLYRDSLTTPWGFRLHGGKDLKSPLTVQKVTVGSPVFGELHKDDVILEIQNCDASHMTHKQAQDLIRNAGGSMLLRVRRCGRMDTAPLVQTYDSFGPVHRASMLGRVRNTLSGVAPDYSRTSSGYGSNSYSDYGDVYSPTSSHASGESGGRTTWQTLPHKPSWRDVPTITDLQEPGWTPRILQTGTRQPVSVSSRQQQQQPIAHRQYPHPPPVRHFDETPAWYGSLRSANQPKPTDRQVGGGLHHSLSPEPSHHQYPGESGASWLASQTELPGGAKNLQYNTPIGLYSKASAQEAVYASSADHETVIAKHGMDVFRPVSSVEQHGNRYLHPQQTDQDIRQSPSLRILESRFVLGQSHDVSTHAVSDY